MSKFPVPSAAPSKRHTGEGLRQSSFIGTLVRWRKVLLDSSVDPTWHEQPRKHLVQNAGNSWWSVMKNESLEGNTNFLAKSAQWNPVVNQFLRQKIVSLFFFQEFDNLNINEKGFVSFQPPHRIRRTRCSCKFPWVLNSQDYLFVMFARKNTSLDASPLDGGHNSRFNSSCGHNEQQTTP